jgi:PKD repeat protein
VNLTVTDNQSCSNKTSKPVQVYANPIANFTASNPCFCTNVSFTELSTDADGTIASWLWEFGDGNTSTAQNPEYHYNAPGTYVVNLTVTDNQSCSNKTSKEVTVYENPAVKIRYYTQKCNLTVAFESVVTGGTSPYAYDWELGDGNTSTEQDPVHTYANFSTLYTVNLTVTDAQNCTGQATITFSLRCDRPNITLRVYCEDDLGPECPYENWSDPFDPTVIEKDSLTFNPAIILWNGTDSPMSAGSQNIHEKKFLRLWYECGHVYSKPSYIYPTIELETTYMLIDRQDWVPTSGPAGTTFFKFPIVEIPHQIGVGDFENTEGRPSRPNVVTVALIEGTTGQMYGKTTEGKIRIEKTYTLNMGETVQFLDHKLQYEYVVTQGGQEYAKVKVWYAGNVEDDSARRVLLGEFDDGTPSGPYKTTWFKRHNERFSTPTHPDATWYARFNDYFPSDYRVEITIGKELTPCDTYYVNGVRYDVMAVEVIDTDSNYVGDEFKYITIKTPLPKGTGSVPDDGIASSQWIERIDEDEVIPLNPPFNLDHLMVDDINVVLWEPTANINEWPVGDPAGTLGVTYFPWAERYLTMQADEIAKEVWCYEPKQVGTNWMSYFNVKQIDMDKDGIGIAYDVNERILEVPPLQFVYLDESIEPRFTTDLYEILNETLHEEAPPTEGWEYFDINTRPDHYTAFELPPLPDVMTPYWNKTGDYLLTSSFLAPNSIGRSDINRTPPGIPRLAFAFDVEHETDVLDEVIMGGHLDPYVNDYGPNVSVRIYGEDDMGPFSNYTADGRYAYRSYEDPFDPAVLQKDSITFNPAIVLWDGTTYPMSADSTDIDVKKYLRMWYEPDHVYSKPVYKRPTIEVETTYLLIDSQDKLPFSGSALQTFFVFPIAEDTGTEQPGLELFENPGSDPDRENVVTLAYVNGSVEPYGKTVNETATIRLEKTYTLDVGEKVQFLDHNLEFVGVVINNGTYYAKVQVEYAGNPTPDTGATVVLGQFDGVYKDPHQLTWFKRHTEKFEESSHPQTTWYAYLNDYFPEYNRAEIAVGKELRPLDVFYVDGVRYDVEAIEVIDTTNDSYADKFKYITIRTPWPKAPTKVLVDDDGIISSQKIWTLPPETPIPLNPPFNMVHDIVDDIKHKEPFSSSIATRIVEDYAPLEVYYVSEAIEPRYSTNLLEILNETLYPDKPPVEDWIKYDVITRPDQYTEFVLPADWAHHDSTYRNDYLITTSFLANNSIDVSDLVDPRFSIPRMAFVFDAMDNTGIYINKPLGAPPVVFNEAPVVNLTVSPGTTVTALTMVEICTDGTLDDQWPLHIEIDWQDGTVQSALMLDEWTPVCFEHKYFEHGTYAVAVTATDKYGLKDTKTVDITVTNDGAILVMKPGWNAFSTPVMSSKTVTQLFGGYSWFYAVYEWNENTQVWETINPASTLEPKRGYFVHGPTTGTVEIELTGTEATYDASWFKTGWNLVGVGFEPVTLPIDTWAYWYDGGTRAYVPTHNMDPGKGYFIKKV